MVGADRPHHARPDDRRRRRAAAGRHRSVAPPALHHDPGLRHRALSLTVLTGWAGQLSLGQIAFAGSRCARSPPCSPGHQRRHRVGRARGSSTPGSKLPSVSGRRSSFSALIPAGIAAASSGWGRAPRPRPLPRGGHLRLRPRCANQTFSSGRSCTGTSPTRYLRPRTNILGIDMASSRPHYYVCLVVIVVAIILVFAPGRTGLGRGTIAVRDNPEAAARLRRVEHPDDGPGLRPRRRPRRGRGLPARREPAGVPSQGRSPSRTPSARRHRRHRRNGLGGRDGPRCGVRHRPARVLPRQRLVPLLTCGWAARPAAVLPGGLVQIGYAERAGSPRMEGRLGARRAKPEPPSRRRQAVPPRPRDRGRGRARATDVACSFGGIRAVDGASHRRRRRRDRRPDRHQRRRQVDAHERDRRRSPDRRTVELFGSRT